MASASSAACQAQSMTYRIRENWKRKHARERALSIDSAPPNLSHLKQLTPVPESDNPPSIKNEAPKEEIEHSHKVQENVSNSDAVVSQHGTQHGTYQRCKSYQGTHQRSNSYQGTPRHLPGNMEEYSSHHHGPGLHNSPGLPIVTHFIPHHELEKQADAIKTGSTQSLGGLGGLTSGLYDKVSSFAGFSGGFAGFSSGGGRRRHPSGEYPRTTSGLVPDPTTAAADDIGFPRRRHASDERGGLGSPLDSSAVDY